MVIHRAIFGSFERFIALLIEHYAGAFPLWLAPVQAVVLPIADRHVEYCRGGRRPAWPPPGCGSSWTSGRKRLDIRSGRRSCRRSPTCWSWATGRRPRARCRCGAGAGGDLGARPVDEFVATALDEVAARGTPGSQWRVETPTARRFDGISRRSLSLSIEVHAGTIASGSTNASGSAKSGSSTTPAQQLGIMPPPQALALARSKGTRPGRDLADGRAAGLPDHGLREVPVPSSRSGRARPRSTRR